MAFASKKKYPEIHITSGLSNISFGMPYQQFLTLAMNAGMDSALSARDLSVPKNDNQWVGADAWNKNAVEAVKIYRIWSDSASSFSA